MNEEKRPEFTPSERHELRKQAAKMSLAVDLDEMPWKDQQRLLAHRANIVNAHPPEIRNAPGEVLNFSNAQYQVQPDGSYRRMNKVKKSK